MNIKNVPVSSPVSSPVSPPSFWAFLFMVSKVFEFGDTIFIVLRKKELVVLQHYHHLCTMLYCWYGTLFIFPINNTNSFFAGMNLCVHTVMYVTGSAFPGLINQVYKAEYASSSRLILEMICTPPPSRL